MKYLIANWKMNMTLENLTPWVKGINDIKKIIKDDQKIILAPSHIHTSLIHELTHDSEIELASQDVSMEEKGSFTGENGILQIKEFCTYSIVGHSERKESREVVLKKIEVCLKNNVIPIVCFTDPLTAKQYLKDKAILAWEDPANISREGVYNPKDPSDISAGVENIRKNIPTDTPLLYGGSVSKDNAANLSNVKGLNGLLIGNASLDPQSFIDIIRAYQ